VASTNLNLELSTCRLRRSAACSAALSTRCMTVRAHAQAPPRRTPLWPHSAPLPAWILSPPADAPTVLIAAVSHSSASRPAVTRGGGDPRGNTRGGELSEGAPAGGGVERGAGGDTGRGGGGVTRRGAEMDTRRGAGGVTRRGAEMDMRRGAGGDTGRGGGGVTQRRGATRGTGGGALGGGRRGVGGHLAPPESGEGPPTGGSGFRHRASSCRRPRPSKARRRARPSSRPHSREARHAETGHPRRSAPGPRSSPLDRGGAPTWGRHLPGAGPVARPRPTAPESRRIGREASPTATPKPLRREPQSPLGASSCPLRGQKLCQRAQGTATAYPRRSGSLRNPGVAPSNDPTPTAGA